MVAASCREANGKGVVTVRSKAVENDVASSYLSGWWFGTFFIFPCIGNNNPN